MIRYIILNPVKAGLVSTPADYPFWGSGSHSREALLKLLEASEPMTPTDRLTAAEP
ncbi:MAG TPA: hypothetical protein VES67_06915 [Vicinamibacterales bacterium]|nr:hypothetical protein [Vicinamibacterales bacterium]